MDLFKFNTLTTPTVLERGEAINGLDSVTWVERYHEPGEVTLVAPLSSGLKDLLPPESLISHVDTLEVAIIENHEITETKGEDPIITITGRTFDSYLENRMFGEYGARVSSTVVNGTTIEFEALSAQIVQVINETIDSAHANDDLPNVVAVAYGSLGPSEDRDVKFGPLDVIVKDLLKVGQLGIRTRRRNSFDLGPGTGSPTETWMQIYEGEDRTDRVIFSWQGGDIDQAQYLHTIKNLKTSAWVRGRWVQTIVDGAEVNYRRRFMIVDASDLDEKLTAPPTAGALTALLAKMVVRGQEALASQSRLTLEQADISNISKYRYRTDFNVGDLVRLDGNYGEIAVMRIVEYTEIEDENGVSSHPTLSLPEE